MSKKEKIDVSELKIADFKEKSVDEILDLLEKMGFCQVHDDDGELFYIIHPQLFDEFNRTLDIYEEILEQVSDLEEGQEDVLISYAIKTKHLS